MAKIHGKAVPVVSPNRNFHQPQLFSLISVLCAPREQPFSVAECRLIVDSRLSWSTVPIDAERSWLYLPEAARARQVAGCLILTAD